MKERLQNRPGNRITTNTGIGTGIAVVLMFILKLCKIDVGSVVGVDSSVVVLGLSSLISALVNLIARDPKKNETAIQK